MVLAFQCMLYGLTAFKQTQMNRFLGQLVGKASLDKLGCKVSFSETDTHDVGWRSLRKL